MEYLIISLIFNALMMVIMGTVFYSENRRTQQWVNFSTDKERQYVELIEWLANNLGEHGDFERDESNKNVIKFRRRQ